MAHTLQSALASDSMANTHPISVPVKNPSQITEIFDSISYDKVRTHGLSIQRWTDLLLKRTIHALIGAAQNSSWLTRPRSLTLKSCLSCYCIRRSNSLNIYFKQFNEIKLS